MEGILIPNKYEKRRKMLFENDFLDNLAAKQHEKLIREIMNDDKDRKKTNIRKESEIFTDESEPETLFE
tara:strand:- start:22215 stop:22421 length:207 start_codon:yes stop_codon:yes gene_type:complete